MTRTPPLDIGVTREALEEARHLALGGLMESMHFHEIAMADPFEAESYLRNLCDGILDALGPPENVTITRLRPRRDVVAELEERGL